MMGAALAACLVLPACTADSGEDAIDPGASQPDAAWEGDLPLSQDATGGVDAVGQNDAWIDQSSEDDGTAGDGAGNTTDGGVEATGNGCVVLGVPGDCLETTDCAAIPEHASTPGYCPGPGTIQCCTPYGTALCDPSVPRDPNASYTVEAPGKGGCPAGMVRAGTFCIDEFEASLVRLADGGSMSPYENPGDTPARAVSVKGAVPQGYINQEQAAEACGNAGKRLCADDEWLRACQGPGETTYPYGDTLELGVCNDHRDEHPAIQYFGTDESWIWSELGNACINQLPESLETAGTRPGCATAEGAFDMMGNLHEWTADPAGTFRGGFYVDTSMNGPGCLYATTAHNTLHWDYSTGFRCCSGG